MNLFTCKQIAEIDRFTIEHEPIADIDLMERASRQVASWIINHIPNQHPVVVFAGPGNNGGDALAIARLLAETNYHCHVFLINMGREMSPSAQTNLERLQNQQLVSVATISSESEIPPISPQSVVLDGLFGSGLTRPLSGLPEKIVRTINQSGATVIAIDIPSGLFGEDNSGNDLNKVVRATYTLTFQFPKLSFFFPEHDALLGQWEVLPIGLHPDAITSVESSYKLIDEEMASGLINKRKKFSHKGTYGHALLIAGSYGKMGAAVLASKACLRAGTGLLTTHVPHWGYQIIQCSVPEAMTSIDQSDLMFTEFPELSAFSAVGVGPGIDKKVNTRRALHNLLAASPEKMVLDADALNILSEQQDWYKLLPENSILTPHPKEFERLAGATTNSWSRLQKQMEFSQTWKVIVVLKGAHTCITLPDGRVFFNSTGNPGMATAGSGDVLTGIILGLLSQPYSPEAAAILGVFLHGLAGDMVARTKGQETLIASDITENLGQAFLKLYR